MHTLYQPPPALSQGLCQGAKFGPGRCTAQHILRRDGKRFHRYEMQQVRPVGIGAPGSPGGQEIQAQPKAGFQNSPVRTVLPPRLRAE